MNKMNDSTIDTSSEIFEDTNLTPNCEYDIEINSLMNNQSLQRQYESFLQLNLYINGSKIDEVYKQNALDENYKKFLLLDLHKFNSSKTNKIFKNNDQISNRDAVITTNSTVNTSKQPLQKRYKIIKLLKNRIIDTTGTSEMWTQTNLKSNCEVNIKTTGHVNAPKRTLKKVYKEPKIIDYIDISSESENETYEDNDRYSNYDDSDIETKSPGNTSQQTSKENYENLEYFKIITVSPSEINKKC